MTGIRLAAGLALARLRHRPGRGVLVAIGVAVAVALEVVTLGTGRVAGDAAVQRGVRGLPPGRTAITAGFSAFRLDAATWGRHDAAVARAFAPISPGPRRAVVLYNAIADPSGVPYFLAGVDRLADAVRLVDGRLPASCTPRRCEVLVVGSGPEPRPASAGIVVVGHAAIVDPLVLSGTFTPGRDGTLLVGDGALAVAGIDALGDFYRVYGWVTPIDPSALGVDRVDGYLGRIAQARGRLAIDQNAFNVTAPDDVLHAEADRAAVASRRLVVVGAEGAALALAFALVAAIGLRRDHAAVVALLERRGATRRATAAFRCVEAGWPVLLGTVAGLVAGVLLVAVVAAHESVATGAVLRGIAATTALAVAAIAALAFAGLVLVLRGGGREDRAGGRALDIALVVALAAAGLAASRGSVDPARLVAHPDPVLAAVPALAALAGGLLAARLLPGALRIGERVAPARAVAVRLALLGALRRPLRPMATTGLVTAAVAFAAFALAYAGTLRQGSVDQAAFAVPLDVTVTEGVALRSPVTVASMDEWRALVPATEAYPVLREGGVVRSAGLAGQSIAVLGLPPGVLPRMSGFRADFAASSPAALDRAIAWGKAYAGTPVPPGTRRLTVDVSGDIENLEVAADLRRPDGSTIVVVLAAAPAGPRTVILPALPDGALLAGLTVRQPPAMATATLHHAGESNTSTSGFTGTFRVLGIAADGVGLPVDWSTWTISHGASVVAGEGLGARYQIVGDPVRLRPVQPTDGPIPVVVDPTTAAAASGGVVALTLGAHLVLQGRVVATAERMPGAGSRFAVLDLGALSAATDAELPSDGLPRELWLRTAGAAADDSLARALAAPRFAGLAVDRRRVRLEALRSDPIARSAAALLVLGAAAGLLVAVLAVLLAVVGDLRDEQAELYALEGDGLTPAAGRRLLACRAIACVALAAPVGVLTALVLVRTLTALVAVTAAATAPEPPLAVVGSLAAAIGVAAGVLIVGALAAIGAAAPALRGRTPARPEGGLR